MLKQKKRRLFNGKVTWFFNSWPVIGGLSLSRLPGENLMLYVKDNLNLQHFINLDLVTNVIVTDQTDGSQRFSIHYTGHSATQIIVADPEQQEDLLLSLSLHNTPHSIDVQLPPNDWLPPNKKEAP